MTKYNITYDVKYHPEGVEAEDLMAADLGGCDNLIVHSIIGTPGADEQLSVLTVSMSNNDGELTPEQQFTVWVLWAEALRARLPADSGRGLLCANVVNTVRSAVMASRETKK